MVYSVQGELPSPITKIDVKDLDRYNTYTTKYYDINSLHNSDNIRLSMI